MNLATWAQRNGVARVTACRRFGAGLLLGPARKVGRLILVGEPHAKAGPQSPTAVYARVSSADQKADLDRQLAWVTVWATDEQIRLDKVIAEVGCALNGHRRRFLGLLGDRSVDRIVVDTGSASAGWAACTPKQLLLRNAVSWSWWIRPRLTRTWCGI